VSLKVLLGKGCNVKYRPREHSLGVSPDRRRRSDNFLGERAHPQANKEKYIEPNSVASRNI
jgi:hypothetical protein